ncbi:MAG: hypothetical protein ACFFFH_19305 [Candidatus Thorarchaeota archaeon]
MSYEEVSKQDMSLEEIKSREILLKINEKKMISKQHLISEKITPEDVTHYTVEAQKITTKWETEKEKFNHK